MRAPSLYRWRREADYSPTRPKTASFGKDRMNFREILFILSVELLAKFAAGQAILPANLRFCLFNIGCDLVKNAF